MLRLFTYSTVLLSVLAFSFNAFAISEQAMKEATQLRDAFKTLRELARSEDQPNSIIEKRAEETDYDKGQLQLFDVLMGLRESQLLQEFSASSVDVKRVPAPAVLVSLARTQLTSEDVSRLRPRFASFLRTMSVVGPVKQGVEHWQLPRWRRWLSDLGRYSAHGAFELLTEILRVPFVGVLRHYVMPYYPNPEIRKMIETVFRIEQVLAEAYPEAAQATIVLSVNEEMKRISHLFSNLHRLATTPYPGDQEDQFDDLLVQLHTVGQTESFRALTYDEQTARVEGDSLESLMTFARGFLTAKNTGMFVRIFPVIEKRWMDSDLPFRRAVAGENHHYNYPDSIRADLEVLTGKKLKALINQMYPGCEKILY